MVASRRPSIAERAFFNALAAWQGAEESAAWELFSPHWRDQLQGAWEAGPAAGASEARLQLAAEHRAQVRPDLGRVHSSWWVRALQEERTSVQRTVVASLPPKPRLRVRRAFGLSEEDLRTQAPTDPEVVAQVVALAGERLVSDVAERSDDPPVIIALTTLETRIVIRLIHAIGLVKWSLVRPSLPSLRRSRVKVLESILPRLAAGQRLMAEVAGRDVERVGGDAPREAIGGLGFTTFARLLSTADPHRVRWALQHLPYALAKRIRSLMPTAKATHGRVLDVEGAILQAAREQLQEDGWIAPQRRRRA